MPTKKQRARCSVCGRRSMMYDLLPLKKTSNKKEFMCKYKRNCDHLIWEKNTKRISVKHEVSKETEI